MKTGTRYVNKSLSLLKTCIIVLFLSTYSDINASDLNFRGQLSGWSAINPDAPLKIYSGARYIPELNYFHPISNKLTLEAEASGNISGSLYYKDSLHSNRNIKPYRIWAKISGDQFEIRAGLQKINFGSAQMLRPLMWFDKLDPRDPLQITDGVYGILGRYYFLNNANLWAWVLYGNQDTKGWEIQSTADKKPEFGGRLQLPLKIGEAAFSYHHRVFESLSFPETNTSTNSRSFFPENRYAFDSKVNLGAGLWMEYTLTTQPEALQSLRYQSALNIGGDYSFNIGNGLLVSAEYFRYKISEEFAGEGTSLSFGALQASYSISIFSNISSIIFYNIKEQQAYNYLTYNYTLDKWTFHAMGFYNPKAFDLF